MLVWSALLFLDTLQSTFLQDFYFFTLSFHSKSLSHFAQTLQNQFFFLLFLSLHSKSLLYGDYVYFFSFILFSFAVSWIFFLCGYTTYLLSNVDVMFIICSLWHLPCGRSRHNLFFVMSSFTIVLRLFLVEILSIAQGTKMSMSG